MKKSVLIFALVLAPFMVFGQNVAIAAGSSSAVGSFQADQYYSGGTTYNNTNTIDVSLITSNPPPAALFNNERYGAMSYTIPGFAAGSSCTVTLYFAETYLTASGGRVFNVSINGTAVLTNFDVYASAGAQNKAIAQSFATTVDASGQIVIQFSSVTENPKINGISIQSGGSTSCSTLGDPNSSGTIDIVDALLIAQSYVGLNPSNFNAGCADVNCSGSVDVVDALLIAQLYVGLISNFPCTITTTAPTAVPTIAPTTGPTTAPTAVPSGKWHLFLLLGQSNMAGFPAAQASDKVQNSRIMVLGFDSCSATGSQTNVWRVAVPPLHDCYQGAIGPGDWFSKTIINNYPATDTIGLIPCAFSGEKIETMMQGGTHWSTIIQRAQLAQQKGTIEGYLFHQGESNSGDSNWPNNVKQFVSQLKSTLGLGDVPFLAGELLYSGSCAGHNTLVNQLPNYVPNCRVISANGLVVDPTDTTYHLHFSHDSQVTFGQRYAQAMISALGL